MIPQAIKPVPLILQSVLSDWEFVGYELIVRSNWTESESLMRRKLVLNEEKLALNETQVFDDLMNIDA